jgi:hypothetical protein
MGLPGRIIKLGGGVTSMGTQNGVVARNIETPKLTTWALLKL